MNKKKITQNKLGTKKEKELESLTQKQQGIRKEKNKKASYKKTN